jgi:hypothetical protein
MVRIPTPVEHVTAFSFKEKTTIRRYPNLLLLLHHNVADDMPGFDNEILVA